MSTLEGKLVEQNGIWFAEFSNKKYKSHHAVILNQEDVKKLENADFYAWHLSNDYSFEVIALTRPSKGFSNLHVHKFENRFNLLGTNGQNDSFKSLIKADYLPFLVKFKI